MEIPASCVDYWNNFQQSVGYDADARFYEAFHFDDNEQHANDLAALVLRGQKRATASLLWMYEQQQKPLPQAGSLSIVTDFQSKPLCIIESTVVDIVPLNEVTSEFAAIEGEGDGSLEFWLRVHRDYFGRECERLGLSPSEDMPVVCEQFEVIYRG
jgi:uncharacterized protein YhfF